MPDADAAAEMRALVDELAETTAALREQATNEDIPAIERNATRLMGVIEQLERNLPPELTDE